jgi:hypothetical protein
VKALRAFSCLLFALALVWYGALVLRFHTHGAVGDDPATYVQMALDLAQRGTVVHEFPLLTKLYAQGLSWDAFLTPGYHVVRETGAVAPNFAFGFPLLLAVVYRVFGENAIDWATPLLGALTLVATFALGNELLRGTGNAAASVPYAMRHYGIGALAVLLLATSPKQIQLVLVPMADVPTQLFGVLALWGALRVEPHPQPLSYKQRRGWSNLVFAVSCGLSLGMAYLIRHSALAMVVPLAIVATRWGNTRREKFFLILAALFVFAITVAPDIFYRTHVLGSPFAVESPESTQANVYDAPRQFLEMLGALLSVTGFGPLALLAPMGWWILARAKNLCAAWVLATWISAFMVLHAPLKLTGVFENDLRYLVPTYPAVALSIGIAVIWMLGRARDALRAAQTRFARSRIGIYALALFAIIALGMALRALASPDRFVARAYGWMSETARADLEQLNAQLPPNAVIGTSDQMAGATLLYAQREIFRPANFLEPTREFPQFLETMKQENRAVFLLGDWKCAASTDASERLPEWLSAYEIGDLSRTEVRDWGLEIRDLPYECAQKIWVVQR